MTKSIDQAEFREKEQFYISFVVHIPEYLTIITRLYE